MIPQKEMNKLKEELEKTFGTLVEKEYEDLGQYRLFKSDDFRVDTFENKAGEVLVSVDLNSSFNKVSQSPIHFILPLSKRKGKRVQSALNYLLRNRKDAGTFWGQPPGFDDLSEDIRRGHLA